ncbi:hypothetical protein [Pseudonocardia sp.]|uniref:hypothetical protein n=1 Tax=Pseudonocardia sp. TaxID=60912 RepID=UPI0026173F92|nr:hypothetical protein [Pseudonocardia sp.]
MTRHYRAHGLAIRSDLELPLPPDPAPGGALDLQLRRGGDRAVPARRPPGEALAQLDDGAGATFYSFARDAASTTLRFPGLCEFVGERCFTDVTVHLHPGVDAGILPVLAAGTVLAVHLKLRGELVLHASAVEVDGRAVAFVGASGMGKSTLAALMCTAGAQLMTDDVLRVAGLDDAAPRAYPGSTESRLREGARSLADDATWAAAGPTADGRLAVRARSHLTEPLPLAACVIPLRSPSVEEVSVQRYPPAVALRVLLRFPRIRAWTEPITTEREFHALGDLVERVPVFGAAMPPGPPFGPHVVPALLEGVVAQALQR